MNIILKKDFSHFAVNSAFNTLVSKQELCTYVNLKCNKYYGHFRMMMLLIKSGRNVFNGTQCKAPCCWPNEQHLMSFYPCLNFSDIFTYVILRE